jgi:hypothetical protein
MRAKICSLQPVTMCYCNVITDESDGHEGCGNGRRAMAYTGTGSTGWAARADRVRYRIILRQIFTVRIFMSNKGFYRKTISHSLSNPSTRRCGRRNTPCTTWRQRGSNTYSLTRCTVPKTQGIRLLSSGSARQLGVRTAAHSMLYSRRSIRRLNSNFGLMTDC